MLDVVSLWTDKLLRGVVEVPPALPVTFLSIITLLVVLYFAHQTLGRRPPGAVGRAGPGHAQASRAHRRR